MGFFKNLLSFKEPFLALEGVEEDLQKRKANSRIALFIGIAGIVLQIAVSLQEKNFFSNAGKFFKDLKDFNFSKVGSAEFILIAITIIALFIYLLYKKTRIFLNESKEPFRYTFSIKPFKEIADTPGSRFTLLNKDQLLLLDKDLKELLNSRIKRFSLLESVSDEELNKIRTDSHFEITGEYCIRQDRDEDWIVHVMPRLKLGNKKTEKIIDSIKYKLKFENEEDKKQNRDTLTYLEYYQITESVFSKVVSEVYQQIKKDLDNKIELFPTTYLKAVALYNEAYDFERSNTIDAYDNAISIYEQANDKFKTRLFSIWFSFSLKIPFFWFVLTRKKLYECKATIGKARCKLYRYVMASYSGRTNISLFALPEELNKLIELLDKIERRIKSSSYINFTEKRYRKLYKTKSLIASQPKKTQKTSVLFAPLIWRDYCRHTMLKQTVLQLQFEYQIVLAWAYKLNSAFSKAEAAIRLSKDFRNSEWWDDSAEWWKTNSLWMIAESQVVSNDEEKLSLLTKATEIDANFEISQYLLAIYIENDLRKNEQVASQKARIAINQYEKAVKLNPGNVAALSSQGFLYWVIEDKNKKSKDKYEQGIDVKSNIGDTYVGELLYGLARFEAEDENGDINKAVQYFEDAIKSEPSVAAYVPSLAKKPIFPVFDFAGRDLFKRFNDYVIKVEQKIKRYEDINGKDASKALCNTLLSYVYNDAGNAAFNLAFRTEIPSVWNQASEWYKRAIELYNKHAVAHYNYYSLETFKGQTNRQATDYLERAFLLLPQWLNTIVEYNKFNFQEKQLQTKTLIDKKNVLDEEVKKLNEPIEKKDESASLKIDNTLIQNLEQSTSDNTPLQQRIKNDVAPVNIETHTASSGAPSSEKSKSARENLDIKDNLKEQKLKEAELENVKNKIQDLLYELTDKTGDTLNQLLEKTYFRLATNKNSARQNTPQTKQNTIDIICDKLNSVLNEKKSDKLTAIDFTTLIVAGTILCEYYTIINSKNELEADVKRLGEKLYNLYDWLIQLSDENLDINLSWYNIQNSVLKNKSNSAQPIPEYLNASNTLNRINKLIKIALTEDAGNLNIYSWIGSMGINNLQEILKQKSDSLFFFPKSDETPGLKTIVNKRLVTFSPDDDYKAIGNSPVCFKLGLVNLILKYVYDVLYRSIELTPDECEKMYNDLEYAYIKMNECRKYADVFFIKEFIDININILEAIPYNQISNRDRIFKLTWSNLNNIFLDIIHTEEESQNKKIQSAEHELFLYIQSALNRITPNEIEDELNLLISSYLKLASDSKLGIYQKQVILKSLEASYKKSYLRSADESIYISAKINVYLSPVLKPLLINADYSLNDEVSGELKNIRSDFKKTFAVDLPTVFFRQADAFTGKQFMISIKEIPLILISIPDGKKHVTLSAKLLGELNISFEESTNKPGNVNSCWIDENVQLPKGYISFIQTDREYILWYLKKYLSYNLMPFINIQQLYSNIQELNKTDVPVKEELLNIKNLRIITQVQKMLIRELVPVNDLKSFSIGVYQMLKNNKHTVSFITNELRKSDEFIELLPGNSEDYKHLYVSESTEELIEKYLVEAEDGEKVLYIEPTDCQKALSDLRELISSDKKACLIIRKEILRLPFYELIKLEFPFVPVLSQSELLPYLKLNTKHAAENTVAAYEH